MTNKFQYKDDVTIGVISDTHGLLRPSILKHLKNIDLIIHAGDFDTMQVLDELETIAPLAGVRGNMDHCAWASGIPDSRVINVGGISIYVLHNLHYFRNGAIENGQEDRQIDIIVFGHTHQPHYKKQNGLVLLNPGAAGHRRLDYPISMALLKIQAGNVDVRFLTEKE